MNNLQKLRKTFLQHGYTPTTNIRRTQFENLLNSLVTGDLYTPEVTAQIWDQACNNRDQISVEILCQTIFDAQNIWYILYEVDLIKSMQEQLKNIQYSPQKRRSSELMREVQEREEEKKSFQEDLAILTQPFGISMIVFMANAAKSRSKVGQLGSNISYNSPSYNAPNAYNNTPSDQTEQIELKWLFYLCIIFGIIQLIVIYQKYDFLNVNHPLSQLMVLSCLMLIFFMNQLDSTYIKFTLALLIFSQLLDVIWLFMNSAHYWNLPAVGTLSNGIGGYMKIIVFLTFLGVFIKIPLGVFLFHYRNIDNTKQYILDLGYFKMELTPNRSNPISEGIKICKFLHDIYIAL